MRSFLKHAKFNETLKGDLGNVAGAAVMPVSTPLFGDACLPSDVVSRLLRGDASHLLPALFTIDSRTSPCACLSPGLTLASLLLLTFSLTHSFTLTHAPHLLLYSHSLSYTHSHFSFFLYLHSLCLSPAPLFPKPLES